MHSMWEGGGGGGGAGGFWWICDGFVSASDGFEESTLWG